MKPKPLRKPKNGFALVVTIGMMVLLTIVVVATLSLSTITLRTVSQDSAQAVARANARMAMVMAMGQLQKAAGPDKRVTATADIQGSQKNPKWTGVWEGGRNTRNSDVTWLVSGNNPDPNGLLTDENSALLAASPPTDSTRPELRAEFVRIEGKQLDGRYAYATLDEGTKVRVDVANPDEKRGQLMDYERIGRSQSPSEPGFASFDSKHKAMWSGFDSDFPNPVDRRILASMGTVALAAKESGDLKRYDIPNHYFDDLTTGGFGLPVNVADGGMKKDLSLILDTTQQTKPFVTDFLGAGWSLANSGDSGFVPGTIVYKFNIRDNRKFTLSNSITDNYSRGFVGPNWGTLYNYARMWETVQGNQSRMIGMLPRVESDLRQVDWKPYEEAFKSDDFRKDIQHQNSGLNPVMAMAQVGFSLQTEQIGTLPIPGGGRVPIYGVMLAVKPVIGLWNPYNIHISSAAYQVEWALSPALQLRSTTASPSNGSPRAMNIFLRDYWGEAGGIFPTDAPNNQGGSYFRLRTPEVTFEPGEYRLFSPAGANLVMAANNEVTGTNNPTGSYIIRLRPNTESGVTLEPEPRRIQYPSGIRLSVTNFDLQDTHQPFLMEVQNRYKGISLQAANMWLTLKAGQSVGNYTTHLNRYTDLWNGGKNGNDGAMKIPEAVVETGTEKPSYAVDVLTTPQHIATWRFYTRTSTEAEGDQGLRGWIDSNPRVLTNNFRFDGSSNTVNGLQGWYTSSNLLGWANDGSYGDGNGGNRGLVQEGGAIGTTIPDGPESSPGRWQGLTGPRSRGREGLTHVVVYDIPRAPLTSVGQFQHANLSRYTFEPGFVVGNSYANVRIPLDSTVARNFGDMGFNVVDISYEANEKLWDTLFFSTLAPDYKGGGNNFDRTFDRPALLLRRKSLPNPRMVYTELPGDTSIDKIISDAGENAPQTIATRIMVEGAFNVNSTSKTAWKAVLSTMEGSELPIASVTSPSQKPVYEEPQGIRFSRLNHPIAGGGYSGGGSDSALFWTSWRSLSDSELEALADAIVREVKDRGPFRSMSEFVNRNPNGNRAQQSKGALQAAIDGSVNNDLDGLGYAATKPRGSNFSDAVAGENQTSGHAGYLLQGDILQCLAPIMQVRSDYFRIRACGEALDKSGKVLARAWCEAFVQRMPEYLDPADRPEAPLDEPRPSDPYRKADLRSEVNKTFGRRMQMVSFRWLNPNEL